MTATLATTNAAFFFDVGDRVLILIADTTGLHESVPTTGTGRVIALHDDDYVEVLVAETRCPHIYRPYELTRLGGSR